MQLLAAKLRRRLLVLPSGLPGYIEWGRHAQRRAIAIVMYPGGTDQPLPFYYWCQLAADEFSRQVDHLADHYTILHLDEVVERLRLGRPLPPQTACITFDDGFRNVATTAFPILQGRQIPSTVFLVT